MKMRKITTTALSGILAAICAFASMSIPSVPVMAASGDVKINSTNFSDSYFRTYVKSFDTNSDGVLSKTERNAVTEIVIQGNTQIKSLSGIKNFPNLTKLDARKTTQITSVDLSSNKKIEYVDFGLSKLESINVTNCTNLTHLDLFATNILFVDVTDCTSLTHFDISGTAINTINIIHLSSIVDTYKTIGAKTSTYSNIKVIRHGDRKTETYFSYNPGATVYSSCPEGYVDYYETEFKEIGMFDELYELDSNKDGLISPDENKNITNIYLDRYNFESYDVFKNFPNIKYVRLSGYNNDCEITYFDGANFPNMIDLYISYGENIISVDVSKNTKLKDISIQECPNLTTVNLNNCKELRTIIVFGTAVEAIDMSDSPYLIQCYKNYDSYNHYDDNTDVWMVNEYGDVDFAGIALSSSITVITEKPVVTPPVTPTNPTTNPSVPGGSTTPTTPNTPAPETGLAGFVERLYNEALGRQSEAQGKEWWINKVKFENYTGSDVATGFLVSDEFLGKQMSNDQFLEVLYKTFFDRASDAQGKAYWLNMMANGYSKSDVINGFCNSTEWANLCLTYGIPSGSSAAPTIVITPNEGTNAFVTRLYTTCLGRAPEQAGFEYWTYRLANMQERGSSAAYGFFTSPEFTGKGYDNPTYVTLLYRTILGREPDQAGLNYWLNLMANGMNRVDVLNGFAASTEWADICSSYGILK